MSVTVTFSIPGPEAPEIKKKITSAAYARGQSISEFLMKLIERELGESHE